MVEKYDTIVLGLGAVGSAALYQLAKRGNKVLGIDQFSSPHAFGSSHGGSRITRRAVGEGEQYVPLAMRSYEIWKDIERRTGKKLYEPVGCLVLGSDPKTNTDADADNFLGQTIALAEKHKIAHEVLDADQIIRRFPQFNITRGLGYFEPEAGFLRPEKCIEAELSLAEKNGATIRQNEKVIAFKEENGLVRVQTDQGIYEASKLIISAGPWISTLIGEKYVKYFKVIREVLFWFDVNDSFEYFTPDRFPAFIWDLPDGTSIYGFPAIDGRDGGIKIAQDVDVETRADAVNRTVSKEEIKKMYKQCIKSNFPWISEKCLDSAVCLYTVTPDFNFVIDTHPEYQSVIIASPCSGHGFKHSAAVGEVLAELAVEGKSSIDISGFKLSRFF